ncbi:histidine--tRNA ligase, partial [Candidatus Parcubacteria bacterium]
TNLPEIGSVFSGGRYDGLVARFSNAAIPATGASVGVERLFAAMEKLGMVATQKSTADVIVLNFDNSCTEWLEGIVAELRRNGIKTDFYLGQETTLKGQLTYAIKQEVPFVIIAGPEEQQRGIVQLRDTKEKKQREVAQKDLPATLKKLLA